MAIHPTAVVSKDAKIGKDVEIGAYSIIDSDVTIGDNCFIDAHVKVASFTTIGPRCRIYYGALVGEEPQDHRFYPGISSSTEIGSDTVIREYVTIHRPPFEGLKTIVGNHCLLMAFVHIAHDVYLADRVTIGNHTALTGHVEVGAGAVISGYAMIHQFCRIGALSMITAGARIRQDIPPFCLLGEHDYIYGPNVIGLRRVGMVGKQRSAVRKAIKTYFFKGLNSTNAIQEIEKEELTPEVKDFIEFIKSSKRGIMPGNRKYSDPKEEQ